MTDGAQLNERVKKILADLQRVPPDQQLDELKRLVNALPEDVREPVETILLTQHNLQLMNGPQHSRGERRTAFVLGAVMLFLMFIVAIFVPEPTGFQFWTFRILTSMGCAGFAVFLPGRVGISGAWQKWTITAIGALAIFVIVYLINPPALVTHHAAPQLPAPAP